MRLELEEGKWITRFPREFGVGIFQGIAADPEHIAPGSNLPISRVCKIDVVTEVARRKSRIRVAEERCVAEKRASKEREGETTRAAAAVGT